MYRISKYQAHRGYRSGSYLMSQPKGQLSAGDLLAHPLVRIAGPLKFSELAGVAMHQRAQLRQQSNMARSPPPPPLTLRYWNCCDQSNI